MEVFLAINSKLTRMSTPNSDTGPVSIRKSDDGEVCYVHHWSVECEAVVRMKDSTKYQEKVAREIEKVRGLVGVGLDVRTYNVALHAVGPLDCSAFGFLTDRDRVLERIVKIAGKEPTTGDIMIIHRKQDVMMFKDLNVPSWVAYETWDYLPEFLLKITCEEMPRDIFNSTFMTTIRLQFD